MTAHDIITSQFSLFLGVKSDEVIIQDNEYGAFESQKARDERICRTSARVVCYC